MHDLSDYRFRGRNSSIASAPLGQHRSQLVPVHRLVAWVLFRPTNCEMLTPLALSNEAKLCRSSRGVHSAALSPRVRSTTRRNAHRTLTASSSVPIDVRKTSCDASSDRQRWPLQSPGVAGARPAHQRLVPADGASGETCAPWCRCAGEPTAIPRSTAAGADRRTALPSSPRDPTSGPRAIRASLPGRPRRLHRSQGRQRLGLDVLAQGEHPD